jgi:hypothetical protein
MDMRFGTWDVWSLYRVGSLKTIACKLVAVREVRWDKDNIQPADNYAFFCRNGNVNHHLGAGFSFLLNGIRSTD